MEKNILFLALLSIGMVWACSKEDEEISTSQGMTDEEIQNARDKATITNCYYVTVTALDGTTHDSLVVVGESWTGNENIPFTDKEVWYGNSLAIERIYQFPDGYFDNIELPDTASVEN